MTELSSTFVALSDRSTVVSPDRAHSITFDREGRFIFYFRQGHLFKRSLASEVHHRFRNPQRRRRRLERAEALGLFEEVYQWCRKLRSRASGELAARLDGEILRWTPELLLAEGPRYSRAYRPVSILPPDQYHSIVLQATEGCSWNRCTFCNFYMDREFRVKTSAEFAQHLEAVQDLMGRAAALRPRIFIGDGNALALSRRRLEPLLEKAVATFPDRPIGSFIDLYSGETRPVADWAALRALGLSRVYIGMETGLDELLRWIDKPGSTVELAGFVDVLKEADLSIALIVMVGLGGDAYRDAHREATLDLLARMPLQRDDLVYLSPFVEHGGSVYRDRRVAAAIDNMKPEAVEQEIETMAGAIRARGVRASRYDIREFVY